MSIIKLLFKNLLRHKLRTFLTLLGIGIAVMAFGLLRTLVAAWYYGVEGSAKNRLITRNAVTFIFPLPLAYREKIQTVPGVKQVTYINWFQGIYIDNTKFFPRLAIDDKTFFNVYPEFLLSGKEFEDFKRERNACIVGQKLVNQYSFKTGDIIPITGDIYPGKWEFVVRGIYHGRDQITDETQLLFHWDNLDQRMRVEAPGRAGEVGWYVTLIDNADNAAVVSQAIDKLFKNSYAETKTETEKEFQQSFVSMSSAIITAIEAISYLIVGIILLVLANTMIMSARERTTEYAVLRTLGFSSPRIAGLIAGESILISFLGGVMGLLLMYPIVGAIARTLSNFFPIFKIEISTLVMLMILALLVGVISALIPIYSVLNVRIVDALRQIE